MPAVAGFALLGDVVRPAWWPAAVVALVVVVACSVVLAGSPAVPGRHRPVPGKHRGPRLRGEPGPPVPVRRLSDLEDDPERHGEDLEALGVPAAAVAALQERHDLVDPRPGGDDGGEHREGPQRPPPAATGEFQDPRTAARVPTTLTPSWTSCAPGRGRRARPEGGGAGQRDERGDQRRQPEGAQAERAGAGVAHPVAAQGQREHDAQRPGGAVAEAEPRRPGLAGDGQLADDARREVHAGPDQRGRAGSWRWRGRRARRGRAGPSPGGRAEGVDRVGDRVGAAHVAGHDDLPDLAAVAVPHPPHRDPGRDLPLDEGGRGPDRRCGRPPRR